MKTDAITLSRIELMHPKVREEVRRMYESICQALTGRALCRFTHTLRTFEEQNALFAQGRTAPGKRVTNARGGASFHNYGLAFDICLIVDGKTASWDMKSDFDQDRKSDWMEVVAIAKSFGWEWGGDWKKFPDAPHFQKTFGYTTKELMGLRKANATYPDI
jgi:peptidoglycan L-alanyl-D-glutamate endopeptidase CwlK